MFKKECDEIIKYMIDKYQINETYENIKLDILNNVYKNIKARKNNLKLNPEDKCLGRKADGSQCSRRKKDNLCYCGSHNKKLTRGHINDGIIITPKEKGKRGRKKKNNNNEYNLIETWVDEELGDKYLIDKNSIVYKNSSDYPELLGIKKNGVIEKLETFPSHLFE